MIREWRQFRDTRYFVSSLGEVKGPRGRILKPKAKKQGYLFVTVCHGGKELYFHVSRMVCEAFHGQPPTPTSEADHRNRKRQDNRKCNLRWLERDKNRALRVHARGEQKPQAKLTEKQVLIIRRSGESASKLAKRFSIGRRHISDIKRRVVWKHLTD